MAAGGKGHARRRENTAAVEANWDAIFSGHGRAAQASGSNPEQVGSTPTAPANQTYYVVGSDNCWCCDDPPNNSVFIDNATGQVVTEDWWPEIDRNA